MKYQDLALVGDFQALVSTCLPVIVLPVCLRKNCMSPGFEDDRYYRPRKKIGKATFMTGRLGCCHPCFPTVSGVFWKRGEGVEGRKKSREEEKRREAVEGGSVKRGWWKDKNEEKEREMKRKRPLI